MLFNSAIFLGFFALVFSAYWLLRQRIVAQNMLILGASYIFYGWWDSRFLILIAASTACDYICGLGVAGPRFARFEKFKAIGLMLGVTILVTLPNLSRDYLILCGGIGGALVLAAFFFGLEQFSGPVRRKAYLTLSILLNLGLLCTFKYFGFFTESLVAAFNSIGLQVHAPMVHILLPVGISFYTFQTLSYTIDIYRKQMKPTTRLVDFAAYVAFFPQLVAGPIERAKKLLPQFQTPRVWDGDKIQSGALLFLWGLFKKIAIADNVAPLANAAFADPASTTPSLMLIGVFAFSVQIYCDFSGYSDMARGLARMLGFDLMLNFNLPYFSRTPSEFWRRWHISLSTWLRDYLYVPLGGNRGGKIMTYRNLMLTMLLGGLWHGAAWTFIAWGAFHGAILAIYRMANIDRGLASVPARSGQGILVHGAAWGVMTMLTLIGWTLFRAETIGEAWTAMALMGEAVTSGAIITTLPMLAQTKTLLFYAAPLILVQLWQRFSGELEFLVSPLDGRSGSMVQRFAHFNVLLAVLCGAVFLAAEDVQEFIYFDF